MPQQTYERMSALTQPDMMKIHDASVDILGRDIAKKILSRSDSKHISDEVDSAIRKKYDIRL
jgi:hypothetical protein